MEQSIARRLVVVAVVVLLVGVSLVIYSLGTTTTSPSFAVTSSATMTESLSATTSTTMITSVGSIAFSSPDPGYALYADQNLTISGSISPAPTPSDSVFIQVAPQGSLVSLVAVTVPVGANGTFRYSTLVGSTWAGIEALLTTYVITATDSNGATGTDTFMVTLPSC